MKVIREPVIGEVTQSPYRSENDVQARLESTHASDTTEFERALKREGYSLSDFGALTVVLDKPSGFALNRLGKVRREGVVVITDNLCPEYWEDLWDLNPQVLLAGGHDTHELTSALVRAVRGEHFRKTPHYESDLTPRERDVLRLCATGLANKQIAAQLGLAICTVKNNLSSAFSKLGLVRREQAMLYYWGLWHWLTPALEL